MPFDNIAGTAAGSYMGAQLTACMVGEDSRRMAIREQMKVVFDFFGQYKVPKQIQRQEPYFFRSMWLAMN